MRCMLLALPALLLLSLCAHAQEQPSVVDQAINFPSKFFARVNKTTADLDKRITVQTQKYLARLAKQEAKMQKKLTSRDSAASAQLKSTTPDYNAMMAKLQSLSSSTTKTSGTYIPYLDSLQTSLKFLQQNKQVLAGGAAYQSQITSSLAQVNQLQAKIQVTNQINQQVAQRQARIKAVLGQVTNLSGLQGVYQGYSKQAYYYSAQMKQFKSDLSDPDKMAKRALGVLNKLPAFQQFMSTHSQLASLFGSPSAATSGAAATAINGLQTRSQIQSLIQSKIGSSNTGGGAAGGGGGGDPTGAAQQKIQAAQNLFASWKAKAAQAGNSGSSEPIPDFKPNTQHTKSFLQRLTYGASMKSTPSTYFIPTQTNISLSVGYKLDDKNTIGLSAGYIIGWGQGIRDVRVSSAGASLGSYLQMKIKGTFYATGEYAYNYLPVISTLPFPGLSDWTKSGLIGVTKKYKVSSKVTGNVQLLWDLLSYSQVPRTNPIVFKVGYNF